MSTRWVNQPPCITPRPRPEKVGVFLCTEMYQVSGKNLNGKQKNNPLNWSGMEKFGWQLKIYFVYYKN